MKKVLLIHCHLIINEYKQALDGALSIIDNKIDKVFLNCEDFLEFSDYEIIDLENNYVFPAFISLEDRDNDFVCSFLKEFQKNEDFMMCSIKKIDGLDNVEEILQSGRIKLIENNILEDRLDLINKNRVGFLLDSKSNLNIINDIDNNLICIDNLFINTPNIGVEKENITNLAFEKNFYTKVKFDDVLTNTVKKIILKNICFDKIIINSCNYQKDLSYLFFVENIDLSNILMMTSLNCAKFLGVDHLYGTITKGKFAKLIVLDKKFNLIRKVGF